MIEEIRVKIVQGDFEFLKLGEAKMETDILKETIVEEKVTFTLEIKGKFIIFENVPARVCVETRERFFSPERVKRLQQIVWEDRKPTRVIETPVIEFTA